MFQNHFPMVLIHKKTPLGISRCYPMPNGKHMTNRKQIINWTVHTLSQGSKIKSPFPNGPETESKPSIELFIPFPKGSKTSSLCPRAQKQKANNQLDCSYPFSRAQRLSIHFPKGLETESKQSFGLFIPFLKGPKAAHTIPFPKGCSCCWSCFCHYC